MKEFRKWVLYLGSLGFMLISGASACSGLSNPQGPAGNGPSSPSSNVNPANPTGGVVGSSTEMGQIEGGDKKELQRTLSVSGAALEKNTKLTAKPTANAKGNVSFSFLYEKHPQLDQPSSFVLAVVKFGPFSKMPFPIDLGYLNGYETPPLPSGTRLADLKCETNPLDKYDDCFNLWRRFLKLEKKGEEIYEASLWIPSMAEDELIGVFIYPDNWLTDPSDFQKYKNFQNQATYEAFLKFQFLGFFTLTAQDPHPPLIPVPYTPPGNPSPPPTSP